MTLHHGFSQHTLDKTVDQIRARMRHLCANMSTAEFEAMVEEMARVQLKYQAGASNEALWRDEPRDTRGDPAVDDLGGEDS